MCPNEFATSIDAGVQLARDDALNGAIPASSGLFQRRTVDQRGRDVVRPLARS